MSGDQTLSSGRSHIGDDLADDHPVSISYLDAMFANTEIVSPVPDHPKMIFYDPVNLKIECSTCHDAHNDTLCSRGSDCKFLIMDNQYSQLCLMCHNMNGWVNSTEFISLEIWNGIPPDPWPYTDWSTVSENACQNCHMPHSAGRSDWLLYYVAEESNCFSCHNGNVASQDVEADFDKSSRHPVGSTTKTHDPGENAMTSGHVECQDCHNPHAYNNNPADAPDVSGMIGMVDGVDRFGISKYAEDGTPALYEYEICFRCHAETSSGVSYVPRVLDETNTRLEFSLTNPSYHPVEGMGQNDDVPSLESPLTTSSIIYCMDCHDSDDSPEVDGNGPKGVHGSDFSPILREQYETDYVVESEERYALCYRCHERESILADVSFKQNISFKGGHSGHLENVLYPSPCSVCHDPHGVQSNPATGSHDHLINFDTRIVSARSGESYPFFTDLGDESGSCTLICHGVDHTGAAGGYDY
jgi:predicted CXXCH cytochrome family protein